MGDGFTTPYVVDLQSGTYMEAGSSVVLYLTSDQVDRFDELSDSDKIAYATKNGKAVIGEEHVNSLGYDMRDDGIWLRCSCGWETNLVFNPSIEEVANAWEEHLHHG